MARDNQISFASAKPSLEGIVEVTEALITGADPLEALKGVLQGALLVIGIDEARGALKPEPIFGLD